MDLDIIRQEIDQIDDQIVKLLEVYQHMETLFECFGAPAA